jgi:hypothetical protein
MRWTLLRATAVLGALALDACATLQPKPPVKAPPPAPAPVTVCVPVTQWTLAQEQAQAAAVAALPADSPLIPLIAEDGRLRKAAAPTCGPPPKP